MSRTLKITNGDIVKYVSSANGYEMLSGRLKVKQDIKTMLTTSVRRSTGLGCGLDEVVGKSSNNVLSGFSMFPAVFDFQSRVSVGLSRLKSAQKNYLFGQRTKDELISDYSQVRIIPSASDPRSFRWRVDILTVAGKESITISGEVS